MGCTFAHPRNSDGNLRIFKALNVDSEGHERNPGKIEITDLELIFHQKGKPPIRWPLRSLRRYGFDAELFSFESGRRCPTGAGIYAFQCQRTEALFNLLQDCIQRAGQDEQPIGQNVSPQTAVHIDRPMLHTLENNNVLRPSNNNNTPSTVVINRSRSQQGADGVVSLQTFPSMSSPNAHEYINTDILQNGPVDLNGGDPVDPTDINFRVSTSRNSIGIPTGIPTESGVQYAQLNLHRNSVDTQLSQIDNNDSSQAMYMNVNGNKPRSASLTSPAQNTKQPPLLHVSSVVEDHHEYLNLGLNLPKKISHNCIGGSNSKCSPFIHTKPPVPEPDELAREPIVTYIEVDFKTAEEAAGTAGSSRMVNSLTNGDNCNNMQPSVSLNGHSWNVTSVTTTELMPPNNTQRTESYAVIDFDKTAAMSNAKNARDDDGARKTRHNSSIEELQ